MAAAACLLGYGEVGLWLKKESQKPNTWVVTDGNPYAQWIEDYGSEHYQNAVKIGISKISYVPSSKCEADLLWHGFSNYGGYRCERSP